MRDLIHQRAPRSVLFRLQLARRKAARLGPWRAPPCQRWRYLMHVRADNEWVRRPWDAVTGERARWW